MAQKTVTYVPRPMPTLDGGTQNYIQLELSSISQSIKTIVAEITKINAILTAHGIT